MVNAVLTLFDNIPELTEKFADRKKEWEHIKDLVEEQERADIAEGVSGVTMATGMEWISSFEHKDTLSQLLKFRLPIADIKSAIQGAMDHMVDCCAETDEQEYGQTVVEPWKKQLELLGLF